VVTPGPKDRWDKLSVILYPVGGLLTALAVAYVGMKGSHILDQQQARETNARLYSELMSRREESESNLRKDMFVSIIQSFLEPRAADIDTKVLNLELLAYNFNDSLNLKPLFLDLARRIAVSKDPNRNDYLQRIYRVGKEVAAKQLFALEGHGRSFRRTVDLEELAKQGRAGVPLDGEPIAINGQSCQVNLRVLAVDPSQPSLQVRLEVKAPEGSNQPDTRAQFEVGWFDFPMIDNTRLTNGLRCAVTLSNYAAGAAADLTTVCFPGEYASLKDRPYYDEVIAKLQQAAQDQQTPPQPPQTAPPK
jgi:hypothetical protein